MAGRLGKCKYCRVLLVIMTTALTITLLIVTNVWDPRPVIGDFLHKLTRLSVPEPKWTVQIDGAPDVSAIMGSSRVVVASRGFVEAYRVTDGQREWRWAAHWAFPAGDVVVARQKPENADADPEPDLGYSVIDPGSGAVKWRDRESIAVWIYNGALVDLVCPDPDVCQLRRRNHLTGDFLWRVEMPGSFRTVRGPNPPIAGVRNPAEWFGKATLGMPSAIPTYLVLTHNDRVYVVNTFRGALIREFDAPSRDIRVAFLGDRLLYARTERADAGCHFHVEAFDIETGESRWAEPGFDLDTARGAGCEQRQDPLGAGSRLVVNGSDAKPMLVEVDQAVRTWTGVPGERVLATDGLLAVILAADGTHVKVIDAATVDGRTLWAGAVGLDAQAAITRAFVIIRDTDAERLLVLRKGSTSMSVKLELKSKATVVGAGADGILLSTARYVGYHQVPA